MRCLKDAGWSRWWARQIWCGAGLGSGLTFGEMCAPVFIMTAIEVASSAAICRLEKKTADVSCSYQAIRTHSMAQNIGII